MGDQIHVLAQQLFGKSSVEECNLQEVKDLAQRYPFFAPAQFLLLEKLRLEGSPDYPTQLQKAVLYYHNPLEFEYFISSERFYTDEKMLNGNLVHPEMEHHSATGPGPEEQVASQQTVDNKSMAVPVEEVPAIPAPVADALVHYETVTGPELNEAPASTLPTAEKEGSLSSVVAREEKKGEAKLIAPAEPAESTALVFEPYHTVDYFASQGIKLSQEELPKDKFGKQLKSFTEWLKTMKRLPVQPEITTIDASSEKNVAHLAEDSVHDAEVVTEAMAEVWLKQGNSHKALEVYNKLCLLNPSKKAYFAAKIENLKRS